MQLFTSIPERDIDVLFSKNSQMIDVELTSAASSDISESLRNQILGKSYKKKNQISSPTAKTPSPTGKEIASTYFKEPNSNSSIYKSAKSDTESRKSKFEEFQLSMQKPEEKQFNSTETQTVPMETTIAGTDDTDKCQCGDCCCQKCEPPNCYHPPKSQAVVPMSSRSSEPEFERFNPNNCNRTVEITKYKNYRGNCDYANCGCKSWSDYDTQSSQVSESDSESCATNYHDLPYQNNEEYLNLLKELERKLIARNRDRVRRTMLEFERLSRQNENLSKPIHTYDDEDMILEKLRPKSKICYKCGRNKKNNSDIMQNEKMWDEVAFQTKFKFPMDLKKCQKSLCTSRWVLHPRTGEWVKVSCFQQSDCARQQNMGRKECCCRRGKI